MNEVHWICRRRFAAESVYPKVDIVRHQGPKGLQAHDLAVTQTIQSKEGKPMGERGFPTEWMVQMSLT